MHSIYTSGLEDNTPNERTISSRSLLMKDKLEKSHRDMLFSAFSQRHRSQVVLTKVNSLAPILLVSIVIVSVILTTCDCKATDNEQRPAQSRIASDLVNDALEQQLASVEPRQFFRVHVAPSQSKRKLPIKHIRGANVSSDDDKPKELLSQTHKSQQSSNDEQRPKNTISKQKINNATLKKLLSQSLLKPLNETAKSNGSSKAPNFKFVFIQRATAPPSVQTNVSTQVKKAPHNVNRNGTSSSQYPASLAASVSKQLASSLLYSAANFVGNLSSVPSLSSLASQIAQSDGKQSATNTIGTSGSGSSSSTSISPTSSSAAPPTLSSSSTGDDQDIRRIQTNAELSPAKKSNINSTKKSSNAKSRPSKVYNLPVKFVSNGQPNHVVFNTIKQHFATIKKIQSVARLASQSQQGKRRKQANGQKVKGNSRLIYLPLKYLSNARPNRIISSKATHKATN